MNAACESIVYEMKSLRMSELCKGHFYLMQGKDEIGYVILYLGKNTYGRHMCYLCTAALLNYQYPQNYRYPQYTGDSAIITYRNQKCQIPGLIAMVKATFEHPGVKESLITFTGSRTILGEFPYELKVDWKSWYKDSFKDADVADLAPDNGVQGIVKTKDLIPGQIYYKLQYRLPEYFIFLGRGREGSFLWYPVVTRIIGPVNELFEMHRAKVTRSNMRVLPISMLSDDPDNHSPALCADEILETYIKGVDVSKIDCSILNAIEAANKRGYDMHWICLADGELSLEGRN